MSDYLKVAYNYIVNNDEKLKEITNELIQDKEICKLVEPVKDFVFNKDGNYSKIEILCGIMKFLAILIDAIIPSEISSKAKSILSYVTPILMYLWSQYYKIDSPMADLLDKQIRSKEEIIFAGLKTIKAYISSLESEDQLKDIDISAMVGVVMPRVQQGEDFLSELKLETKRHSTSKQEIELKRAIELCTLYVKVATFRSSLLWSMYLIIKTKSERKDSPTEKALFEVIKHDNDIHKEFLMLFTEPRTETIRLLSYFNLSEHKEIEIFAETTGAKFQNLSAKFSGGNYVFRSKQWLDFPLQLSRRLGILRSYRILLSRSKWAHSVCAPFRQHQTFKLEVISDLDNIFAIRSYYNPNIFAAVCFDSICRGFVGNTTQLDESMKWKIIQLKNGFYIICSVKYPNYIAYIEENYQRRMMVKDGFPHEACLWTIEHNSNGLIF